MTRLKRPDDTRVEITPEMIDAGADELLSFESRDLAETQASQVVRQIFEAMAKVAPRAPQLER